MKNVYDIRHEKNLIHILPCQEETGVSDVENSRFYGKAAVILYLYYPDTLSVYEPYLDAVPRSMDVYILSSRKDVLEAVRRSRNPSLGNRIRCILKENRGRDVSALLVAGAEIVRDYTYVCFLHDKKERSARVKKDTDFWIENLWGNLIGSSGYISRILRLFEENPLLGVLAPPEPVGDHFCTWYGYGWHGSYGITRELADRLALDADLSPDRPPVTIGTALWFRRAALRKLFEFGWKYSDFDDGKLKDQNYLSYGIERIFAYVAQDAGFETGTVMTAAYAEKQTSYLQYSTGILFSEAKHFFPVPCIYDLEVYRERKEILLCFARRNRNVYLYGAGEMGRFCFFLLREADVCPRGFLVSHGDGAAMVCGLPVYPVRDVGELPDCAVVITVFEERIRKEMSRNLEDRGFYNYLTFWGANETGGEDFDGEKNDEEKSHG